MKVQKLLLAIFTAAALSFGVVAPVSAAPLASSGLFAQSFKQSACEGLTQVGGGNACDDGGAAAENRINTVISNVVNLLSWVVGIIAVVMIVIAGFRYITSGGDSSKVSGAKSALIYAIVGLVIVALAQFIVHFVLTNI